MGKHRRIWLDTLTASGLTLLLLATGFASEQLTIPTRPSDVLGYLLLTASGLLFSIRSVWPLGYGAAALALPLVYIGMGYPDSPIYFIPIIAMYVLIRTLDRRFWLLLTVASGTAFVLATSLGPGPGLSVDVLFSTAIWFTISAAIAVGVHLSRRRLAAVIERAELAERTSEQEARRRVTEERLRIARELHDVVSHSFATISLQAGVAAHLLADQDNPAHEALTSIRGVSNGALTELRTVLGLLRSADTDGAAPLAPVQGLAELPELVTAMRRAGLEIETDINTASGTANGDIPEVVGLSCYRIVQEALTNIARHAGAGTHVRLRVALLAEAVELEVSNDEPGADQAARPGHDGRGILGMRERAHSAGGSCTAGREPNGEFRVWALLPTAPV